MSEIYLWLNLMSEPLEITIEIPSKIVIREGGEFSKTYPSTFKLLKIIQKHEKRNHPIRWFFRSWYSKMKLKTGTIFYEI